MSLKHGIGRRLTGLLGLWLLMLNLLAGALLPPRAIDLTNPFDLLSICSAPGMAQPGNTGDRSGEGSDRSSLLPSNPMGA